MKRQISAILVLFFLTTMFSTGFNTISFAASSTFYVSATGSDSNNGSISSPWLTVGKAFASVPAGMGNTVSIGSGQFNLGVATLVVPNGVNIVGQGVNLTTLIGQLEIKSGANNININNLKLSGNNKQFALGIKVRDTNNTIVHDVVFDAYLNQAINIMRSSYGDFYNISITDSCFSNWVAGTGGNQTSAMMIGDLSDYAFHDMNINTKDYRGGAGIGTGNDYWSSQPWADPATKMTNVKIYNCTISVDKFYAWNNGWSSQCCIELWHTECKNVEIYNNSFNNNVSLAGPGNTTSIRVHNNKWYGPDNLGYAIETDIDNLEFDHNIVDGGMYPIACFDTSVTRKNLNAHHNVFANQISPILAVDFVGKQENFKFNNNTVYITNNSVIFNIQQVPTTQEIKNNIFKSTVGNNSFGTIKGVDNNCFYNLSSVGTNAMTFEPALKLSGDSPDPFYRPQPNSPVIDRGVVINGITNGFYGLAPDLGAIEAGSATWLVGPQVSVGTVQPDKMRIELESFNSSGGGVTAVNKNGTACVSNTVNGSWTRYNNINFGAGYKKLNVRFAQKDDSWIGECIKVYIVDKGATFNIANPPSGATECFINRNTGEIFVEKAEMITIDPNDIKVQFYTPGLVSFANDMAVGVKDLIVAYTPNNTNFSSGAIDWIEFSEKRASPLRLEMENFSSSGGGVIADNKNGVACVSNTVNGSWTRFNNVNFGVGYKKLNVRFAQKDDSWIGECIKVYVVNKGAAFNIASPPSGAIECFINRNTGGIFVEKGEIIPINPNDIKVQFYTPGLVDFTNTAAVGVKDVIVAYTPNNTNFNSGSIDWIEFSVER